MELGMALISLDFHASFVKVRSSIRSKLLSISSMLLMEANLIQVFEQKCYFSQSLNYTSISFPPPLFVDPSSAFLLVRRTYTMVALYCKCGWLQNSYNPKGLQISLRRMSLESLEIDIIQGNFLQ